MRWQYPAYNPDTGMAYGLGNDGCFKLDTIETLPLSPDGGINLEEGGGMFGFNGDFGSASIDYRGALWAVNVDTGELVATVERPFTFESGVTATAGGVIFTSTPDGYVIAYDADDLTELWSFWTGFGMRGTPISYSVGGKQYIAVLAGVSYGGGPSTQAGGMLYVFTL